MCPVCRRIPQTGHIIRILPQTGHISHSSMELWLMFPACRRNPQTGHITRILPQTGHMLPVVLGSLVYRSLVWCGAVGYVSCLWENPANQSHNPDSPANWTHNPGSPANRTHNLDSPANRTHAAFGTWLFGLQVIGLVWSCGLCVLFAGESHKRDT